MKTLKKDWYNWIILFVPWVVIIFMGQKLPDIELYKFSFVGPYKVYNQFLLLYIGTIIFYLIVFFKGNDNSHKGSEILKTIVVLFGAIASIVFLVAGAGLQFNIYRILWLFCGLFAIVYGNYLPVFQYKSVFGINNKWTKSDDRLWSLTHRIAGKLWFFSGLIIIVFTFIFDVADTELLYAIIIFCLIFFPHVLSFLFRSKSVM